jgi:hypothetical protein
MSIKTDSRTRCSRLSLVASKEVKMSPKETYALTVKCTLCNFQVTQQVEIEPENITRVKTELIKQAAAVHKKHGDLRNFVVY